MQDEQNYLKCLKAAESDFSILKIIIDSIYLIESP